MVELANALRPEPSPYLEIFKGKIPQNVLAYHCRVTPGRMNQMLGGFIDMPRHVEERLEAVRRELDRALKEQADNSNTAA